MMRQRIGIDLGSSNISIYNAQNRMFVSEPSVVAFDKEANRIVAYGLDAKNMYGKTSSNIELIYPIQKGVIADFESTDQLLNFLLKKAKIRISFLKPKLIMNIPLNVTSVEERAFQEVAERMGSREVEFVSSIKTSALGAGLDLRKNIAYMVVNIGGGRGDVAILSKGEIIKQTSFFNAGNTLDQRIATFLKNRYHLSIGLSTAEKVKQMGTCFFGEGKELEVSGKDLTTNLPHTITVDSNDIKEAIQADIYEWIDIIKELLLDVDSEIAADIAQYGITITGGSALLDGLGELIGRELDIPIHISQDSYRTTIDGISIWMDSHYK